MFETPGERLKLRSQPYVVFIVLAGCSAPPVTSQPPPPSGLRAQLSPDTWAPGPAATLTLSADDATEVQVYGDLVDLEAKPSNVGQFLPFSASVPVTLSEGDGPKFLSVVFRTSAGGLSAPLVVSTTVDSQPPEGTLRVLPLVTSSTASGITASRQVLLAIESADALSGIGGLRVAGSITALAQAEFRPATELLGWELPAGSGAQTVYLQLKDKAGNLTSGSAPISGSIILDDAAPTAPILTLLTGSATSSRAVSVRIESTDASGSLQDGQVLIDGDVVSPGWLAVGSNGLSFAAGVFTWSGMLSAGEDGPRRLAVAVRDQAGNVSPSTALRLSLQTTPPDELEADLRPGPFTRTTAATLWLRAHGAAQVKISGDVASVDGRAADVGSFVPWRSQLAVELTTAEGLKTLDVTFRNEAGLESTITAQTQLDSTAPAGTAALVGSADLGVSSAALTSTRLVQLQVSAADLGSGVDAVRIAQTPAGLATASWQSLAQTFGWLLTGPEGNAQVALQLLDRAGNESAVLTASTVLDLTGPTAPLLGALSPSTASATQVLSLQSPAVDVLSGPVRYELLREGQPSWQALTFPANVTLTPNQVNTLRMRAIDGAGNASPEVLVTVVHDDLAPAAPVLTPAARIVNTPAVLVALASPADPSFRQFEFCSSNTPVFAACPATCTFLPVAATFLLPLTANTKACLRAIAVDRAGNTSPVVTAEVVFDVTPPVAPTLLPSGDLSDLEVSGPAVPLFFAAAGWDAPLGNAAAPWSFVAALELDTGTGFTPVCPQSRTDSAWDPCGAVLPRCSDARLRCQDDRLVGLEVPAREAGHHRFAVRVVDGAGNVSPEALVEFDVRGPRVVLADADEKLRVQAWGSTLVYSRRAGAAETLGVLELGPDGVFDPALDVSCASEFDAAPVHRQGNLGTAGLVYARRDSGAFSLRLRKRGLDERLCSPTAPAPISLITLPGNHDVVSTGVNDLHAMIASVDPGAPACGTVRVREAGYNGVLGDGDDWSNSPLLFEAAFGSLDVQLRARALLMHKGLCGGGLTNKTWELASANYSLPGASSPNSFWLISSATFEAELAVLSPDGRSLASVPAGGGFLFIRHAGLDGRFMTADDVVAAQETAFDEVSSLAIEPGRVVVTARDLQTSVRSLWEWSPGSNGIFESSASDDLLLELFPSADERSSLSLAGGQLFWSQRSNLYSVDRRNRRWESIGESALSYPVSPEPGVLLQLLGSSSSPSVLQVDDANGERRQSALGLIVGQTERPFVASGKNLLVTGRNATTPSLNELIAVNAGLDGKFFTIDDVRRLVASSSTDRFFPLAGQEGKALFARGPGVGADLRPFILEPGAQSSWAAATIVSVQGSSLLFSNRFSGGISASQAAWVQETSGVRSIIVRSAGPDNRFGTADDAPTATLLRESTTIPYENAWVDVATARGRIAFVGLSGAATSALYVVDAGADKRANTADDRLTVVNLPFSWSGTLESRLAFAGDSLAFTARDERGVERAFVYSLSARSLSVIGSHDSRKRQLTLSPVGKAYWVDDFFPASSVFSAH